MTRRGYVTLVWARLPVPGNQTRRLVAPLIERLAVDGISSGGTRSLRVILRPTRGRQFADLRTPIYPRTFSERTRCRQESGCGRGSAACKARDNLLKSFIFVTQLAWYCRGRREASIHPTRTSLSKLRTGRRRFGRGKMNGGTWIAATLDGGDARHGRKEPPNVRVVVAAHDTATDSRKRGPVSLALAPSNVPPNANLSATAHRIVGDHRTSRPAPSKGFHRSTTIGASFRAAAPCRVSSAFCRPAAEMAPAIRPCRAQTCYRFRRGGFLLADCRTGMSSSGLIRRLSIVAPMRYRTTDPLADNG